jgi:hypothetical protein
MPKKFIKFEINVTIPNNAKLSYIIARADLAESKYDYPVTLITINAL